MLYHGWTQVSRTSSIHPLLYCCDAPCRQKQNTGRKPPKLSRLYLVQGVVPIPPAILYHRIPTNDMHVEIGGLTPPSPWPEPRPTVHDQLYIKHQEKRKSGRRGNMHVYGVQRLLLPYFMANKVLRCPSGPGPNKIGHHPKTNPERARRLIIPRVDLDVK